MSQDDNSSSSIVDQRSSLLNLLAGYALHSLRIYVILPDGFERAKFDQMKREVKADLPDIDWK